MAYSGKRVLVLEDEMLVAMALEDAVIAAGHECLGPTSSIAGALALLERNSCDAAVLNIVIAGQRVDPVCTALERRGIPFGFATGLDAADDGGPWKHRPRVLKPYDEANIRRLLAQLLSGA